MEEDEYTDYLEQIIKRDYFPDLLKLEAKEKYEERLRAAARGQNTGSTARSHVSKGIPSILLRDTPY